MLHLLDNPISQCNLKFASNKVGEFEGYASVFNSNDAVNDTILPGAFSESLKRAKSIKMFINHAHYDVPVGSWLDAKEDSIGLFVRGDVNMDHRDGPGVYSAMKRGDMDGMSIGFAMSKDDYEEKPDGGRVIKNLSLREISIVTFPCEEKAKITAVKMSEIKDIKTLSDAEMILRESGYFSRAMACAFVSQIKQLMQSESAEDAKRQITELQRKVSGLNAALEAKASKDRIFEALNRI